MFRVTTFKCPCVIEDQNMCEDNQNVRPGCSPDTRFLYCEAARTLGHIDLLI